MANAATTNETVEFTAILGRIQNDRVRYFYMMLGDAIAEATNGAPANGNRAPLVNVLARKKPQ